MLLLKRQTNKSRKTYVEKTGTMSRKSIGAQIRSVFNVTDPFSKEFSEDSSDDETLFNQSFKHNSTLDSQSSVNYLAQWSEMEKEGLNSMLVNWDSPNVSLNASEEIAASNEYYNYFGMVTPDDTKPNLKRQQSVSIKTSQENLLDVKVEPKSLKFVKEDEEERFDSNARHALSCQDLRKKIFQNILQRKVVDFESSRSEVLLAPDSPDVASPEMFKFDAEVIPESDSSFLSNKSQN